MALLLLICGSLEQHLGVWRGTREDDKRRENSERDRWSATGETVVRPLVEEKCGISQVQVETMECE